MSSHQVDLTVTSVRRESRLVETVEAEQPEGYVTMYRGGGLADSDLYPVVTQVQFIDEIGSWHVGDHVLVDLGRLTVTDGSAT